MPSRRSASSSRMPAGRAPMGSGAARQVGSLRERDGGEKVSAPGGEPRQKGANVLVGGTALDGPGYFYEPTVLADVPREARVFKEEIFGPVAPITTFSSEDEAIASANDTEYGLVAYVFTKDFKRAIRVVERLDTGMVGLNQGMVSNAAAPFGGVKQSGIGREGGFEGIDEYLELKYVAVNTD